MEQKIELCSDIHVELTQQIGNDNMVVAAMKASTNFDAALHAQELTQDEIVGKINFLMKNRHGCYDEETDVLTSDGWINFKDVTGKELFATLSSDGYIEYQKAYARTEYDYQGDMFSVDSDTLNLLVTPNHNLYISNMQTKIGRKQDDFKLLKASEVNNKNVCFKKTGNWRSVNSILNYNQLSLIGFAIGDGYLQKNENILQFHLRKQRKIDYLYDLCKKLDLNIKNFGESYYIKWPFKSYINLYNSNKEKIIDEKILLNCTKENLLGLYDGLINSDGSVGSNGTVTYSTTSSKLCDQIQQLCLHIGMVTTYDYIDRDETRKRLYNISILQRSTRTEINRKAIQGNYSKSSWVPFHGKVYCVSVPNKILYIRRKGKSVWCGNSVFEHGLMTFAVDAPIFVWREHHRHRIASYNEESARYSKLRPKFWVPKLDRPVIRNKDWKPSKPRHNIENLKDENLINYNTMLEQLIKSYEQSWQSYENLLSYGVMNEVARACLPVAIFSRCWVTMNPRALMNFLSLRVFDEKAKFPSAPQMEIEEVAKQYEELFKQYWPLTHKAFIENGRVAP